MPSIYSLQIRTSFSLHQQSCHLTHTIIPLTLHVHSSFFAFVDFVTGFSLVLVGFSLVLVAFSVVLVFFGLSVNKTLLTAVFLAAFFRFVFGFGADFSAVTLRTSFLFPVYNISLSHFCNSSLYSLDCC